MAVILIVEDDLFIRDMAEAMVREWGYQTLSASDMTEALSLLRAPQDIDALFTDINLKTEVYGGCELARQALKLRPDLRVLYTTGNSVTAKLNAMFVEGTYCLPKPYTECQLRDSVERLLAA